MNLIIYIQYIYLCVGAHGQMEIFSIKILLLPVYVYSFYQKILSLTDLRIQKKFFCV